MLLFIEHGTKHLRPARRFVPWRDARRDTALGGGTAGLEGGSSGGGFPCVGGSGSWGPQTMPLPSLTAAGGGGAEARPACIPFMLGMNMKNAFKHVLYFFTVINRCISTFHVLAFL